MLCARAHNAAQLVQLGLCGVVASTAYRFVLCMVCSGGGGKSLSLYVCGDGRVSVYDGCLMMWTSGWRDTHKKRLSLDCIVT